MASDAMRLRTAILFLLAGFPIAAADFHQLIHEAQGALARADFAGAEMVLHQACDKQADETFSPDMLASCAHHLALVDEARNNFASAEPRLLEALAEWKQAGLRFNASYAMSMMNLGEVCRKQLRYNDAEKYLTQAVELARELQVTFPSIYPEALTRLAGLYLESDRPGSGRSLVTEALDRFSGVAPRQTVEEARALDVLGGIDLVEGRLSDAASRLSEAVSLSNSVSGEGHPETAAYQFDLALVFIQTEQFDRAEPLLSRARFVFESQPLLDRRRLGMILAEQSLVACRRNKFAMAEQYAHQSLEILAHAPGGDRSGALLARVSLGTALLGLNRRVEGERSLVDAVADERRLTPNTCLLAAGLRELADLRAAQHDWPQARGLFKEAIEILQKKPGPKSAALAYVLKDYAETLKREGRSKAEAKAIDDRAKAILSFAPPH